MEYEDRVRIATPEGVELDLGLAGIGSRLAARLLDVLIQGAIAFVILLAIGLTTGDSETSDAVSIILVTLIVFAIFWGYNVAFETFNSGRTPGKMALGLRVVGEHGEPETFSASAVRNLLRIVDELMTVFLAGTIAIIASRDNQRLGDMAAGTLVVKERTATAKTFAPAATFASLEKLEAARHWDLSALTTEDNLAVRRFLERRFAIDPQSRAVLAAQIAAHLRPKVAGSEQVGIDEHFLELVASVQGMG